MTTKLNLWALTTALILPLCGLAQTELRNEGQRIERPLLPDGSSTPEQDFLFSWEALPGRSYFMVGGFDLTNLEYFPVVTGVNYDSATHGTLTNADRETVSWQMEFSDTAPTEGYWVYVPDLDGGTWVYQDDTDARVFFVRLKYNPNEAPSADIINGDADGDHVPNQYEIDNGFDPLSWLTSDGDLVADEWEWYWFGDLDETDAINTDGDFTNNLEESELGLDPTLDERPTALAYSYDALGRLTAVSGNQNAISYTMDEEGNITLVD